MSEFEAMRPYHDDEVPAVVARILEHPDLPFGAANLLLPAFLRGPIGQWLVMRRLRAQAGRARTVADCQLILAEYFQRLIDQTSQGVTVSGLENLSPEQRYLFISNHRDIVLDSGLLNFVIHRAGHTTSRMAVGDNLLRHELAADLMKLNKSFVVTRGASGTRDGYRIAQRTSRYVKESLSEGVSVWIAQKEGRAKDGWDRTDPALLKMLALAHKPKATALQAMVEHSQLVPVAVSYELDPCAAAKAHELSVTAATGSYAKREAEDVQSIITGLIGQKGRVHVHIGKPIAHAFQNAQELAMIIDKEIVGGLRVFPTHTAAADTSGVDHQGPDVPEHSGVMSAFNKEFRNIDASEQPFWLDQYANLLRNRSDLGIV